MSVNRLKLAHNTTVIATELENVESNIISVSTSINAAPTPYIKKTLIAKLDNLISQRDNLIIDLNKAIGSYNMHVESLKS